MKVTSSIWIKGEKYKFNELTTEEQQECVYKLEMQSLKAVGEYMPSPEWFSEHPLHKEFWDNIITVQR